MNLNLILIISINSISSVLTIGISMFPHITLFRSSIKHGQLRPFLFKQISIKKSTIVCACFKNSPPQNFLESASWAALAALFLAAFFWEWREAQLMGRVKLFQRDIARWQGSGVPLGKRYQIQFTKIVTNYWAPSNVPKSSKIPQHSTNSPKGFSWQFYLTSVLGRTKRLLNTETLDLASGMAFESGGNLRFSEPTHHEEFGGILFRPYQPSKWPGRKKTGKIFSSFGP